MKSEVQEFIDQARLDRPSVERIAEMLPEDDAELDNWIGEAVREADQLAFLLLVFGALSRERPVDARHLEGGAKLVNAPQYIVSIAFRVRGDMPEYFLAGIRKTTMHGFSEAVALLAIAIWCDERRGGVYPEQLLPQARALARRTKKVMEIDSFLLALAKRADDSGLRTLVRQYYSDTSEGAWNEIVDKIVPLAEDTTARWRAPVMDFVGETPAGTIRRAMPRIGRNEPCPCGSGKKYKNCCYGKDLEQPQQPDLNVGPERQWTEERLDRTHPTTLAGIDPLEIPRPLLETYFLRLCAFNLLDHAAESLEKLGYSDKLEASWHGTMFFAVRAGRRDIAERLMKLREAEGFTEEQLKLSERLLLAAEDPAKSLLLIEEAARNALKTENSEDLNDLAYAVAFSKFSSLGLLLYRGVIPLLPPNEAKTSYEQMLIVRDRLNLAPEDPISEFIEEDKDAIALREAQEKFEAKRREVRALKESIDQLQKELARRERTSARASVVPIPTADTDERVRELRQEIENLETTLKERHDERNQLRRRLEKTEKRMEALREHARLATAKAANDKHEDNEEDLLLPQESEENHPLRIIEFPRNFPERLNEFPRYVARATMSMLGRLGGGDSAAFAGALRLKAAPAVMRQRIGIDFRLLFRLLPDRIQVIDLIPRQDLERKIKTLM
jgi:hypothetical protein